MINGRKIIIVTPGFAPAQIFFETASRMSFTEGVVDEKWLLLNKYPLPSVEENEKELVEIANKYGYNIFDSEDDLGEVGSTNNFLVKNPQPPGTIFIGRGPDSFCADSGWDKALGEVLTAADDIAMLGLAYINTPRRGPGTCRIAEHRVLIYGNDNKPVPFDMSAIPIDFLNQVGGFEGVGKYWGGVDHVMREKWNSIGKKVGWLCDFPHTPGNFLGPMKDPRYYTWRIASLHGSFEGNFAQWILEGRQ